MADIREKWQPVGLNDCMSPSEAIMEMVRRVNESLGLTDNYMEEIALEMVEEYALEPPRTAEMREADAVEEQNNAQDKLDFSDLDTDPMLHEYETQG